jgi:hypothetical protein
MEVSRLVITVEHPNDDPEESAQFRHRDFSVEVPLIARAPNLFNRFLNRRGGERPAGMIDPHTALLLKSRKLLRFLIIFAWHV